MIAQPHPHDIPNHYRITMDLVVPQGLSTERVRVFFQEVIEQVEALKPHQDLSCTTVDQEGNTSEPVDLLWGRNDG